MLLYLRRTYLVKNVADAPEKNGKYRVEVEDGKIIEVEEAKVKEFEIQMSNRGIYETLK